MQQDFCMIIWIDWDLNKIKDHDQTTKTHMERVEDGQKKEMKLHLLSNDGKAFFMSYPFKLYNFMMTDTSLDIAYS